jgi:ribosomal protein S18 acetylase RimI-like enzyme
VNITYRDTAEGMASSQLRGFFVGWPNPPSPETHLRILAHSDAIVLAVDEETGRVAGFITAITDHESAAYIPHLEVLPAFQGQGIGSELVRRMVERLRELYMIDLLCDEDVQPFYARLGFRHATGMCIRNYGNQDGAPDPVLLPGR